MVTVIPARDDFGEAFRQLGAGLSGGYTERSDENAIKGALTKLPEGASARDILNAITSTKTYSPEAKQKALKNAMTAKEYELLEKKYRSAEEKEKAEKELKSKAAAEKKTRDEALLDIRKKQAATQEKGLEFKVGQQTQKIEDTINRAEGALGIVGKMREISAKNNLGYGGSTKRVFSAEARKDKAQYEQLGKSLISFASPIVIRNKAEFEVLASDIYDSTKTDAEREGILLAMEDIIRKNMPNRPKSNQPNEGGNIPEGKIRVKNKQTGKTGTVTPYEGMDAKYERV